MFTCLSCLTVSVSTRPTCATRAQPTTDESGPTMNKRAAFKIPPCIPLHTQLPVLREQVVKLANSSLQEYNIFVPGPGTAPELAKFDKAYEHIRVQTEQAFRYHRDQDRELVCALAHTPVPNAYAISCGTFDAVVVSTGLIESLHEYILNAQNAIFNMMPHEDLATDNFRDAFKAAFKGHVQDVLTALNRILYQTAMNYLLGHEFGHLARGHLIKGLSSSRSAVEEESVHGIRLMSSDTAGRTGGSKLDQAMEIDADVQGCRWATHQLATMRPVDPANQSHFQEVFSWIQSDLARLNFIFAFCAQIAYVALGARYITTERLLSDATHPPTGLRALVATDTQLLAALSHDPGQNEKIQHYVQEARRIVAVSALATVLLSRADDDARAETQAKAILKSSTRATAKKAMNVLGLEAPTPQRRREMDIYLGELSLIIERALPALKNTARWEMSRTVPWTTIGIKTARQAAPSAR